MYFPTSSSASEPGPVPFLGATFTLRHATSVDPTLIISARPCLMRTCLLQKDGPISSFVRPKVMVGPDDSPLQNPTLMC